MVVTNWLSFRGNPKAAPLVKKDVYVASITTF